MPNGRKTLCDVCRKVRPDCLWTERVKSGNRYVVCARCREYWQRCGHELRNVDPDFTDAGEPCEALT